MFLDLDLDVVSYLFYVVHFGRIGKVFSPVGTDPVRESAGRQEGPARERKKTC